MVWMLLDIGRWGLRSSLLGVAVVASSRRVGLLEVLGEEAQNVDRMLGYLGVVRGFEALAIDPMLVDLPEVAFGDRAGFAG